MENPPPYAIESVDNALRLLLLLRRDGALRVSTAAEELGVARSTAHRLLAMLKYRGFVVQDTQRMYRPGATFRKLSAGSAVVALPALARPHLEWLAQQVGETVNLVIRTGTDTRFVESVEGTEVLRVGSRVGVVLPAHRTSGGKVLLADLSRSELEAIYPQHSTDSEELTRLRRALSAVRRRRYGTNYEETEPGVIALGVAVRDADAVAVAALSISAPKVRYHPKGSIVDLLPQARAAAERIRRDLIGG